MLMQGRSVKLADIRSLAQEIAGYGLSVTLTGPDGVIARIGDVNAPVMQRVVTGSPHIRLGSAAAVAPLLRRRSTATPAVSLPPATLFPLVPTVSRRIRRRVTTTHYLPGSGRPRLIFVIGSENWNGQMPREFDLLPNGTTIGSGAEADLQLEGLSPVHAEIRHTKDDEYVLYPIGELSGSSRLAEASGRKDGGQVLRTGTRIELGKWKMAYFREEFADHGRPHGGRVGGELARQKPQVDPRPGRSIPR
ncbi:FHA domain-containing protein [Glaciihabitans sp. INWT7]|nr:FHA domain-containing protein [Glaciihabitans sp. INWT7]